MTKLKSKFIDHYEDVFFCDCHDRGHLLVVSYDDKDADFRYVTFSDEYRPYSWRDRIAKAWKMLCGKTMWVSEVVLTDDNLADLTRSLVRHLYVNTYGYDINSHVTRLQLALGQYYNALAGVHHCDVTPEDAADLLSDRVREFLDIFDGQEMDKIRIDGPTDASDTGNPPS